MTNPLKAAPALERTHIFLWKKALDIFLARAEVFVRTQLKLPGLREGWVLLTCYETRLTQSQVAALNDINPNVMVRVIDQLEKDGYLKRVKNPQNRREYFLDLTPKGSATVKAWDVWNNSLEEHRAAYKSVFAPLSVEKVEALRNLALKVIHFEHDHPTKPSAVD